MLQSLLFKEWIKTRRVITILGLIFAAMIAYAFITNGQLFRVSGAVSVWSNVILKGMPILPDLMKWLPVLAGILLAVSQFAPEMTDKRLKLTLHLPLTEVRILTTMLLYGVLSLFVLYALTYMVLSAGLSFYYPGEILANMFRSSAPPVLGGFFGYLLTSWICLEPVWRQRIGYAFATAAFLSVLYTSALPGAYSPFIPYLVVLLLISFSFPFYSMARFKDGAQ